MEPMPAAGLSREDVRAAVEEAMLAVLQNKELTTAFWRRGYEELANHAGTQAGAWVGKRILTSLIWAAVGAGIVWLVRNGALK